MTGFWMMANPVFGRRFRHLHKLHTDGFMGLNAVCLPDGNPPGAVYRSSLPATPVSTPLWDNHSYFSEQILRDRLCRTPSPRKCRLFEPRGSIPDMGLNTFDLPSTSSSPANDVNELDNEELTSPEDERKDLPKTPKSSDEEEIMEKGIDDQIIDIKENRILKKRLFVGNISYRVTKKELKDYFSQFGKVIYAEVVQDHFKRWPKGYGFVTFAKHESVLKALAVPVGSLELDNRKLRVYPAEEKRTSKLKKEAKDLSPQDFEPDFESVPEKQSTLVTLRKSGPLQNVNDLEDDVIYHIFSFLSLSDRVKIERVCKRWQILVLRTWQSQESLEHWSCFSYTGSLVLNNLVLRCLLKKCAPNLKKIDVSKTVHALDFQAVEIITHLCPNLEYANLSGLRVTNVSLQQLAQKCPRLKTVIVQKCFDAGEKGYWWLLHLCKDLEYLDASESMRLTGQCFHMARPKLKTVVLNKCTKLCPQGFSKLATKCHGLTALYLNECFELTDRALELLCQSLRNLKTFHLGGHFREITPTGLHHIGRLSNMEELLLKQNQAVNDDVMCAIARGCRKLRWLNISSCFHGGVSDASLKSVSECPRLRTLFISYLDKITDDGISTLARQGQLEILEARGCVNLGDKGFIAVALLCPSLKELDVSGCTLVTNYTVQASLESINNRSVLSKLQLTIGGTSVKVEELQLDNENLVVSTNNYCQDSLRPDLVDIVGNISYDDDIDDHEIVDHHHHHRAGSRDGWPVTDEMAEYFLTCDDPGYIGDMWPS